MINKLFSALCVLAIVLAFLSCISLVSNLLCSYSIFNRSHVVTTFPVFSYWSFIISLSIAFILSFIPKTK